MKTISGMDLGNITDTQGTSMLVSGKRERSTGSGYGLMKLGRVIMAPGC